MQRNAPAFIASLPTLAHSLGNSALARALTQATLAARLNAYLPAAVWRKNKQTAFYDTEQPRDKYGRWANIGSLENGIKLSHKELKDTPTNPHKLYENYLKNGGRALAHNNLPAVAEVTRASIQHHNTIKNIKQRNAIINQPKLLQALFCRGHLKQSTVKYEKDGKPDKNKADWAKCWHIRGNIKINGINHIYAFTVFQHKTNGNTELYDFAIK
jgi:hypothetical protein